MIQAFQRGIREALYAGFSAFLLFLIWLYISWTVVLLGAEMSYAHQNQSKITWDVRRTKYSYAFSQSLALKIILFIGDRFIKGQDAPSHDEISAHLNVPERLMNKVIATLLELKFIYSLDGDEREQRYTPARSLDSLTVKQVIEGIRNNGMNIEFERNNAPYDTIVSNIEQEYEHLLDQAFGDQTIHHLLTETNSGT